MRKGLLIIGSVITGIGAIALWIGQTWVVSYDPIYRAVYPDPAFSLLSLIIIFFGLLLGIYGAIADPKPSPSKYVDCPDGLAILERRYALSEISREEYLEKKQDMKKEGV